MTRERRWRRALIGLACMVIGCSEPPGAPTGVAGSGGSAGDGGLGGAGATAGAPTGGSGGAGASAGAPMGGSGGQSGDAGRGGSAGAGGASGQNGAGGHGGDPIDSVFPCTEEGVRDAIAAGGGPHAFACDEPTRIDTSEGIFIDNDVILDGLDRLALAGGDTHHVFVVHEEVNAELRRMEIVDGGVSNDGTLTLDRVIVRSSATTGLVNRGIARVTDSTFGENESVGVYNVGELNVVGGAVSGNGLGLDNSLYGVASLVGVTISDNGATYLGGGIISRNWTNLYLEDCVIADNRSGFGGGLYNLGPAHIVRTRFVRNYATRSGGAISNRTGASDLLIEDSTIEDNFAEGYGGGVMNYDYGRIEIVESHVLVNKAGFGEFDYGPGGGIYNGGHAKLTVRRSNVRGNIANSGGGGVFNDDSGEMLIDGSTISGNLSDGGSGGISNRTWPQVTSYIVNSTISDNYAVYNGGGLTNTGTLEVVHSTIAGNRCGGEGSALSNYDFCCGDPLLVLRGTIIEGDCTGDPTIQSAGDNIESPGDTCNFSEPSDSSGVASGDLKLAALSDNGGPTKTRALEPGSVGINHIPALECVDHEGEQLLLDQRGLGRDTMCDVGAFEAQPE